MTMYFLKVKRHSEIIKGGGLVEKEEGTRTGSGIVEKSKGTQKFSLHSRDRK